MHSQNPHPSAVTSASAAAAATTDGPAHKTHATLRRSHERSLSISGCVPTRRPVFRLFKRKTHTTQQQKHYQNADDDCTRNSHHRQVAAQGQYQGHGQSISHSGTNSLTLERRGAKSPTLMPPPQGMHKTQNSARPSRYGKNTIVSLGIPSGRRVTVLSPGSGSHLNPESTALLTMKLAEDHSLEKAPSESNIRDIYYEFDDSTQEHNSPSSNQQSVRKGTMAFPNTDDSSDWNLDFSSPSPFQHSQDTSRSKSGSGSGHSIRQFDERSNMHSSDIGASQNTELRLSDANLGSRGSRYSPGEIDNKGSTNNRLKVRAIDQGVLKAQQNILLQEKYLIKINSLSNSLTQLRPFIMRCLVFELPYRNIQIGTSAFVSDIREPQGSSEPTVEEERLWELWRQTEALLTIMENNNVAAGAVEGRISLSKKRAIMLAFCDWEQYSAYVEDTWNRACRGDQKSRDESESRRSSNGSSGTSHSTSISSRWSTGVLIDTSACATSVSTKKHRHRRKSIIGIALSSLQRISDEAQCIKTECEKLLELMSPVYCARNDTDNDPFSTGATAIDDFPIASPSRKSIKGTIFVSGAGARLSSTGADHGDPIINPLVQHPHLLPHVP